LKIKMLIDESGAIKMGDLITGIDTGDVSIEEVNDTDTFRSLKDSWNELLQQCPDNDIFLTWEWLFHWWKHYGGDKKLRILLIKERDKILGIAPFMQSRYRIGWFSVNVLENICSENCDYSGIILTEKKHESIALLMDYLARIIKDEKLIIRIYHIPENSVFLSILREQYPSHSDSLFLNEKIISFCPYIELPATFEEYFNALSKKKRANVRRARRSLEQDHVVEFRNYSEDDDLRSQLQVLFEFHQKRWQEKNIISKFTTSEARGFYMDVSQAFIKNKWLNFSFLNVDGKTVSAEWGFDYNKESYYMSGAFDLHYSGYSLGTLHLMKLVENAIQNGQRKFDFLKGDQAYKSRWATSKTANIRITIAKSGLVGRYRAKLFQMLIKYRNVKERGFGENITLLFRKLRYRGKPSDD